MIDQITFTQVAIAIALILICAAWPRPIHVVHYADGDSIEAMRGKRRLRIRLKHFDAPEYHQDGGWEARRHLVALLDGKSVRIGFSSLDVYGRTLGRCYVNGIPVDWLMIAGGHAWPATAFGTVLSFYPRLRRKGLWAQRRPIHPAYWRRAKLQNSKN